MKHLKSLQESFQNKPKIKKYEIDGFLIFQGKDANSNDYLTFEMSQDEDLWFHAKGVPGSHVLIKIKDKLPMELTIKKVAEIAAKNSKSNDDKITVVYCKKKYVKKTVGLNSGQVKVDYKNANEIIVSKI
jgi:predicted ribosome quality control (RQC) complex YloA/Tae2 family protein